MDDPKQYLTDQIVKYFVGADTPTRKQDASSFIKLHTDKGEFGDDICFPTDYYTWRRAFRISSDLTDETPIFHFNRNKSINEEVTNFIQHSREKWKFPIENIQLNENRCLIYLERLFVYNYLIKSILIDEDFGKLTTPIFTRKIHIQETEVSEDCTLTTYRAKMVENVLRNLLKQVKEPENDVETLLVNVIDLGSGNEAKNIENPPTTYIKCGLVLHSNVGKMTNITKSEYSTLRSKNVRLVTMNKYNIVFKDEEEFNEFISKIGNALVTIDLLDVRHSSPMCSNEDGQSNNKGGIFILYNSARLEVLLRKFEEKAANGEYPPLPPPDSIDLTLLREPDEWQLMFGFLLTYPNVIKKCISPLESGTCSVHSLLQFVSRLIFVFSAYYRKTKVLTNSRSGLPVMYARIYLLRCVQKVLNECLAFLDIEPVKYM